MTDQSKLEKLFRQHYRQMYRLATMLLHDDAESKDVVHDIFAHLLNDSKELKEETAEHYLLTCVRNRCLNVIRSRQIQERVEHLYLLDLDTTITPTELPFVWVSVKPPSISICAVRLINYVHILITNERMNKTDLLLQMMEQPQHYTAEEWQEILADEECRELYTLMSKTQSAIDATRADQEVTDDMIDAEWQRLSDEKQEVRNEKFSLLKFAAMFVGILMLSGIAFAAIHFASHYNAPEEQDTEVVKNSQSSNSCPQLAEPDTIATRQPKLYDNVPLGEIFEELSACYHVKVVYQNEDAPRLRLFYQWKPEYTLEKVVEMLNNFEWIQIQTENDTLFIRTTAIPAKDC